MNHGKNIMGCDLADHETTLQLIALDLPENFALGIEEDRGNDPYNMGYVKTVPVQPPNSRK